VLWEVEDEVVGTHDGRVGVEVRSRRIARYKAAGGAQVPSVRRQRRDPPAPTPGRVAVFDVEYSPVALSPLECQSIRPM